MIKGIYESIGIIGVIGFIIMIPFLLIYYYIEEAKDFFQPAKYLKEQLEETYHKLGKCKPEEVAALQEEVDYLLKEIEESGFRITW